VFSSLLVLLRVGLLLLPRWKASLVSELMMMLLSFMTAVSGLRLVLRGFCLKLWLSLVVAVVAQAQIFLDSETVLEEGPEDMFAPL
jgi:hypothetical protein